MFGSTFPQYYFPNEMRKARKKVHPVKTPCFMTSDYPFIKVFYNSYAAVKFATRAREIIKSENEPLKCYK